MLVCFGAGFLALGRYLQTTELSPWIVFLFVATGGIGNLILARLLRSEWFRSWLIHASCLFDVSLVALAIVYVGPGAAIAGFFLVLLPCGAQPGRVLGVFALSAASAAYVVAAIVHNLLSSNPDPGLFGLVPQVLLEVALFAAVATALVTARTDLIRRIAQLHSAINLTTRGCLKYGTPAARTDHFGLLEQSLNAFLKQAASTIEEVRQQSESAAVLALQVAQSGRAALQLGRQVASAAAAMGEDLADLQIVAEASHKGTEAANEAARVLLTRAESHTRNTRDLDVTVHLGRDQVARTSEAGAAIGEDISKAASIVNELGGLSRQIGSAALSIATIARHTHVLALNAAIEAARAERHGGEFAVVADRVRTLAGDAGLAARNVGDLVCEVQTRVSATSNALAACEEHINEIRRFAEQAHSALDGLCSDTSTAADFATATAEFSRSQTERAASLAGKMSQVAAVSSRCLVDIDEMTAALATQVKELTDLDLANRSLGEALERLQQEVAHAAQQKADGIHSCETSD